MGIEAALLGTALSATTAGTATAGLLGSGGLLFGIPGLTGANILAGLGAASSLFGGISGQAESSQQAEYAMAEAEMAGKESARQASEQAIKERAEYKDIQKRQKLAYLKSGVSLEGSPLLVMEETRRKGESNIEEILSSGASSYASSIAQGQLSAQKAKSMGRQQLMKGITGALGAFA